MSWTREKTLALIREVGLVPIVRAPSPEDAMRAAEAIIEGGIGIAEITMTVPNALHVMERVVEKFGDKVLLGAGTILDPETCRAALLAGAEFIVTPLSIPRSSRWRGGTARRVFLARSLPPKSFPHGRRAPTW